MEQEKQFQCTGDCFSCRAINERKTQWQYCAAQHAYNAMRIIQSVQTSMEAMAGTIEELKIKFAAIQDNEAMVFNPHKENEDISQEGDGEEE